MLKTTYGIFITIYMHYLYEHDERTWSGFVAIVLLRNRCIIQILNYGILLFYI